MTEAQTMEMAEALRLTAKDSLATKMKVGAILCKDGDVLQFGFNKAPEGYSIEDEHGETIRQNAIHAEMDVIYRTNRDDLFEAEMFITHSPCRACALAMKAVGIKAIYYLEEHNGSNSYPVLENPLNLTLIKI